MFCNLQNSRCKSSVAAAVRKKMAPKRICLIGAGPSGMSVLYQLERLRKEGVAGPLEVSGFWCVKFQPFIHVMSNRVQLLLSSIKIRKCCSHLTIFFYILAWSFSEFKSTEKLVESQRIWLVKFFVKSRIFCSYIFFLAEKLLTFIGFIK